MYLGRVHMELTVTNQHGDPVLTNLVKAPVGRRESA
jgi:predicted transglutaminase-like cysteine proteinase